MSLARRFQNGLLGRAPRGTAGATGATGATGPQGPPGIGSIIAAGVAQGSTAVLPGVAGRNVPLASSFTLVNAHSATIVDNTNGPLVWQCPTALAVDGLSVAEVATPAPASNDFVYTVHANFFGIPGTVPLLGFSDGTKYDVAIFGMMNSGGIPFYGLQTWNTTGSNASNSTRTLGNVANPLWFRFSWIRGTTTRKIEISFDGFTWFVISTTNTPFLTPSQFVIGANINIGSAVVPVGVSIDYLVQS
jgi:hypothetical protein